MKLIFVYNASGGKLRGLFDLGHKILSPATYDCGLCKLTHGAFTERGAWKTFREDSGIEMEFYHIDEFEGKYDSKFDYPVVLTSDTTLAALLDKSQIDRCPDVETLIKLVKQELTLLS